MLQAATCFAPRPSTNVYSLVCNFCRHLPVYVHRQSGIIVHIPITTGQDAPKPRSFAQTMASPREFTPSLA